MGSPHRRAAIELLARCATVRLSMSGFLLLSFDPDACYLPTNACPLLMHLATCPVSLCACLLRLRVLLPMVVSGLICRGHGCLLLIYFIVLVGTLPAMQHEGERR